MKKEIIGILVCTLLASVAVAPVVNALTVESNEINIVKEPTSSLQDTDAWEEIISDIITRFEDAETQDEKIAILEEIPVVMDIYGLLPEDMTVEETQELIVSGYLGTLSSDSFQSDQQSNIAGDSPLAVSKNAVNSNSAQLQVSESKQIIDNNGKLNPAQPEEWSSDIVNFAFGLIDNLQYICPFYCFNCVNVRCRIWDYKDECYHCYHYTNGEELCIHRYYLGILLDFFVFAIF